MTEDEREELIEKIARSLAQSHINGLVYQDTARAALAVAEPVIREQCAKMADAIAKGYRVYRDHYPHAEGAEQAAAAIREGGKDE